MRRLIRTSFLLLLILLVIIIVGGWLYLRTSLPTTSGTVHVPGLDGVVDVIRDGAGVPHIFATTDHDAIFALGYLHAQDRLWQMEMNRRIGNGRLSEVLGESALNVDKFQRTMGYARVVRQNFETLPSSARMLLESYAAGINAWLAENHTLPPEFLILGITPEPWTVYDSLVWAKMMAWDLAGDYDLELLRAQLTAAVGAQRAAQLLPAYPKDALTILPADFTTPATADLLRLDTELQDLFHLGGAEVGSNNWVVSGQHTQSGKPLLANDPHLGTSIPSTWYLVELQGKTLHITGSTLPGLPAVVIGHNEHIAWGMTNLNPDVQDLYIEHINPANPNQYAIGDSWAEMEIAEEFIYSKGATKPLRWAARRTRHGPLISDVTDTPTAMALRWTALDNDDTTVAAFFAMNSARNWDEFRTALRSFVGPSQNFVYADIEGNIGYIGPGHIPIRQQGEGMLPAPGWSDDYEWTGWIPFDELPQILNPAIGYLVTANNRVVGDDYPYLLSNDWAPPYRAQRITNLIEEKRSSGSGLTANDMAEIQADQVSLQAQTLLPILLTYQPQDARQQQALDYLRAWDGNATRDSVAASIYEAWMITLPRALFGDDLRGDLYDEMANRANPLFVLNTLKDVAFGPIWCDNVLSAPQETCAETALTALDSALDDLTSRLGPEMTEWQWGKLHFIQYPHRPFSQVAGLNWLFDRSIANGGNRYTVNVGSVNIGQAYDQTSSPSYRQIIDLADFNQSRFSQTTGQSGNLLSAHYADLVESHRNVTYLPMSFGRDAVAGDLLHLEQ
ncbi:MAG: penicillin acylase family protein [Caldilineaceae bacterium]